MAKKDIPKLEHADSSNNSEIGMKLGTFFKENWVGAKNLIDDNFSVSSIKISKAQVSRQIAFLLLESQSAVETGSEALQILRDLTQGTCFYEKDLLADCDDGEQCFACLGSTEEFIVYFRFFLPSDITEGDIREILINSGFLKTNQREGIDISVILMEIGQREGVTFNFGGDDDE